MLRSACALLLVVGGCGVGGNVGRDDPADAAVTGDSAALPHQDATPGRPPSSDAGSPPVDSGGASDAGRPPGRDAGRPPVRDASGPPDPEDTGPPPCQPAPERCNQADDDCDGQVDEDGVCGPAAAVYHAINFQPEDRDPPDGWARDTGRPFDGGRGFGWGRDVSHKTRRRNRHADPLLDTAIFPGEGALIDRWEIVVEPGTYLVSLASGDPLAAQGPNHIVAEGVLLVDDVMTGANEFVTARDQEVVVVDGRLTLDVGDGTDDTALNWVVVRSRDADQPPDCQPSAEECNGRDDDCDGQVDEGCPPDCQPEAEECNGRDDDCDGQVDEGCPVDPECIRTSLGDGGAIDAAGFTRHGGNFRDGGWAVDATCHRLTRRLAGDWSRGRLAFDAKGLFHHIPHREGTHGCERFILNMNRGSNRGADHSRLWWASMTSGCGAPRGNLRVGLAHGRCCNDSGRLPDADDNRWHRWELAWTTDHVTVRIDGDAWIDSPSGGAHVGSDVDLEFGSECARGDETGAVFRNLEVCRGE